MKVIVGAVDVGKRPALLHYSFLIPWNRFTEIFSRWPDCFKFWWIIWVNSLVESFIHHRSSHLPFPSLFSSYFPSSNACSILPFLHLFISFMSTSLSAHALLNFPSLVFVRPPLRSRLSIPAQVGDGFGPNWVFFFLRMSFLDETLGSLCRSVLPVLMSLISLLAARERSQEAGAGRALLSITLQPGADRQKGGLAVCTTTSTAHAHTYK